MHDLKSPYKHLGETRVCFPTRVDPNDLAYVRKKFPYGLTGVIDTISATLFYKFVNELRKHEPFEPSCFVNDPGFTILKSVLDRAYADLPVVERESGRRDTPKETGARHERRGTSRIRKKVRDVEIVSSVATRIGEDGKKTEDTSEAKEK